MNIAFDVKAARIADIPLQEASRDIWDSKYRLKTKSGEPIDLDIGATYERVARALAAVEVPEKREEWYRRFVWALRRGAIPAGRIMSNAGAEAHKPAKIGRASCRERVEISVGAVALKKKRGEDV